MKDVLYANAFISSHMANYMLTQVRIRAMLACPTPAAAAQVLQDCGYESVEGTDDEIIDHERVKAYKLFIDLCPDEALSRCIEAKHEFKTTPNTNNIPYEELEKKLYQTIAENTPNIKTKEIKNYFQAELDAYNKGQKPLDEFLYNIALEGKNNLDTLAPLFYWYVLKNTELTVVKIILMGKRFEFSRDVIIDNMRGLYERFK